MEVNLKEYTERNIMNVPICFLSSGVAGVLLKTGYLEGSPQRSLLFFSTQLHTEFAWETLLAAHAMWCIISGEGSVLRHTVTMVEFWLNILDCNTSL